MNNAIQIFNNPRFGDVRVTTDENGEPLFCLADICRALELTNPRSVKTRLDESDVQLIDLHAVNSTDAIVGNSMANFVTESGFYDVILQSSSPKVKSFRKWVTSEVLPSIRKHGAYMTQSVIERTLQDPDYLIQLATTLKEERQKRIEAEHLSRQQQQTIEAQKETIQQQVPKVAYYDETLQSVNTLTTTQIAKELGCDASKLNQRLKLAGVLFRQSGMWMLRAPYSTWNLAATRTQTYTRSDGNVGTSTYTVWNERGRRFIHALHECDYNIRKACKLVAGKTRTIGPATVPKTEII